MSSVWLTLTQTEKFPSALCAQVGSGIGKDDLWFPPAGGSAKPAIAICRRCPHCQECFAVAMADPTLRGVWGATTANDRNKLRRQLKP